MPGSWAGSFKSRTARFLLGIARFCKLRLDLRCLMLPKHASSSSSNGSSASSISHFIPLKYITTASKGESSFSSSLHLIWSPWRVIRKWSAASLLGCHSKATWIRIHPCTMQTNALEPYCGPPPHPKVELPNGLRAQLERQLRQPMGPATQPIERRQGLRTHDSDGGCCVASSLRSVAA